MNMKSKFIISEYGVKFFHNCRFSKKVGVNINKNLKNLKSSLLKGFDHYLFLCKKNRWSLDSTKENILFLKTIRSYKGSRHWNNYPARGQRTHTNASKKFKHTKI